MAKRDIEAEITGSVWTHSVGVGQQVSVGTTLVILECMKMELPVTSPYDGVVRWLKPCGETVQTGDVVASVDVP